MHTFTVEGPDVTRAWIAACNALDRKGNGARTGYHTVVRIADATADDPTFREDLERVRAHAAPAGTYKPVETVANTIFPQSLGARCASHEQLADRYRALYPAARRFPGNHRDTYFGRLIAYPGTDGHIDQIAKIIDRLTRQTATRAPMTAAYEVDVTHPSDIDTGEASATADALVHTTERDNLIRGFPCLSMCSFQLDRHGTLHTAAYYRSHFMLERAYGNYLGLGRLSAHIARHAGLKQGTLTVFAGYAQLDGPITSIRPLLTATPPMLAA
ncbi:hypothetical protein ACIBSV_49315 [Embleya sp. NPDC050154]|uniref:hypothetical protein n=1 Tax=Embleya sp. NPDC050154 TaxID=3363988 RepID=UPI0037AD3E4A